MSEIRFAITRNGKLGELRFATHREAMNYATILNLDAPDAMESVYAVKTINRCAACFGSGTTDDHTGKSECYACNGTGDE